MQAREGRIVPDASDRAVAAELVALQRASYAVEAELIGFDQIPGLRESVEELVAAGLLWLGVREGGRLAGRWRTGALQGAAATWPPSVEPRQLAQGWRRRQCGKDRRQGVY